MFFVHSACEGITIFALVAQLMERSVLQAQGMRIVQYFKMDSSWLKQAAGLIFPALKIQVLINALFAPECSCGDL